ncbi:hypothetical protein JHK86_009831 [Glycine max]|nr:hypothetical protein JHK86_009831 [Glycine max]
MGLEKREVNLKVLKVSEIESKVLDATDNEPWGPHGTVLAEISKATKKFFEYVEPSGKDVGLNVRKKVENIVSLLNDKDKIHEVRNKAANCDKESKPGSLVKLACVSAIEDMLTLIESMLSIETSNPKNLELQDALLTWIRELPLLLIQLGDKHPTCFNIFPLEEAGTKGVKLCSLWQENVKNSAWHPFKVVTVDDKASMPLLMCSFILLKVFYQQNGGQVLSVTLDEWSSDEIDAMIEVRGNSSANSIYETYFPKGYTKPGPDVSHEQHAKFIRLDMFSSNNFTLYIYHS